MVLGYALLLLKKRYGHTNSLTFVYVDHGVRPDTDLDFELIKRVFGQAERVVMTCEKTDEQSLRHERLKVLKSMAHQKKAKLLLAHHIDDSFEWSLMRSFKSGSTPLGIPLVNGKIRRPFHCFTKRQILAFATDEGLLWREDSTNSDQRYERNYLRSEVISKIKERYPKYLKHYVQQQKKLLMKSQNFEVIESKLGVHLFIENDYDFYALQEKLLELVVKKLKREKRSRGIRSQLAGLVKAFAGGKKGSILLAGEVYVHLGWRHFYITRELVRSKMHSVSAYRQVSLLDFKNWHRQSLSSEKSWDKGVVVERKIFPFQEEKITQYFFSDEDLSGDGHFISASKLLSYWERPQNSKIPLNIAYIL